jgi:hypothetical protein
MLADRCSLFVLFVLFVCLSGVGWWCSSLGPDSDYSRFDTVTKQSFESTRDVTPWQFDTDAMHSGEGTSEVSLTALIYAPDGAVEFDYIVVGSGTLSVLVNGERRLTIDSGERVQVYASGALSETRVGNGHASVRTSGAAKVTWRFVNGRVSGPLASVSKAVVFNVGAKKHRQAALQCDACPIGTAASVEGSSVCVACQANEFAATADGAQAVNGGAVKCVTCPRDQFSYAMSSDCYDMAPECRVDVDFVLKTTPCVDGKQTQYAVMLSPRRCVDTTPFEQTTNSTIDCKTTTGVCRALRVVAGAMCNSFSA